MSITLHSINTNTPNNNHFTSSLWSWRPLVQMCTNVAQTINIDIDFNTWELNNVDGIHNPNECKQLATALKNKYLNTQHKYIYLILGTWVDNNNKAANITIENKLNQTAQYNTLTHNTTQLNNITYHSAHKCSITHLNNFIKFLYTCNGFNIK